MKRPMSSGTARGCPLKSFGSATVAGLRECGVKQAPHNTSSQSEKKTRVFPKFAQKIPLSHVSPIVEHFLQSTTQFHHRRDTSKFQGLRVRSGKDIPKTRGSQQELGHRGEFASVISQKSISLLKHRLHLRNATSEDKQTYEQPQKVA
jgi:hypothetical protein